MTSPINIDCVYTVQSTIQMICPLDLLMNLCWFNNLNCFLFQLIFIFLIRLQQLLFSPKNGTFVTFTRIFITKLFLTFQLWKGLLDLAH